MEPLFESSLDDESIPPLSEEILNEIQAQLVTGDGHTINIPNGGHSLETIKKQMVFYCLKDPRSLLILQEKETQELAFQVNTSFVVPDIKMTLEEAFLNEKLFVTHQLSSIDGLFNLCIFRFLLNDASHILASLVSFNNAPILSTGFLTCFEENNASVDSSDVICRNLEEFHIVQRISEIFIWDNSLTELRLTICDKLNLPHNKEMEWKQYYPEEIMKISRNLKMCINRIRTIFDTTLLPDTTTNLLLNFNVEMFQSINEQMEKVGSIYHEMNGLMDDRQQFDKASMFYTHEIPTYPLLWFQALNIMNIKTTLDRALLCCTKFVNFFNNFDISSGIENPDNSPLVTLATYFINVDVKKWLDIADLSLHTTERLIQECPSRQESLTSQEPLHLHNRPFITIFQDIASDMQNFDPSDSKYLMIIASLRCWQRKSISQYTKNVN